MTLVGSPLISACLGILSQIIYKTPITLTPLLSPVISFTIRVTAFLVNIAKSRLERDLYWFSLMKKFGLVAGKDDFSSLYVLALYNLINTKGKNSQIIKIFEI